MNNQLGYYTKEEASLLSVVENYRNAIDVTQINLTKKEWKKVTASYYSRHDIKRSKKPQKLLQKLWNTIVAR